MVIYLKMTKSNDSSREVSECETTTNLARMSSKNWHIDLLKTDLVAKKNYISKTKDGVRNVEDPVNLHLSIIEEIKFWCMSTYSVFKRFLQTEVSNEDLFMP